MKKFTYSKQTIDAGTGELLSTVRKISVKADIDSYCMLFIDRIEPLFMISSGVEKDIFFYLCIKAEYNTGNINLGVEAKKELCTELNITTGTLYNSLAKLRKVGLIAGKTTEFTLNPLIVWKGEIFERKKLINEIVELID